MLCWIAYGHPAAAAARASARQQRKIVFPGAQRRSWWVAGVFRPECKQGERPDLALE